MNIQIPLFMRRQPDETTCGPTCLHSVYSYYGDPVPLEDIIAGIPMLETGGTMAVMLACHALRRGYHAAIYTYNIQLFDPTWAGASPEGLRERLLQQRKLKPEPRLLAATDAYLEFLGLGGQLRFRDLSPRLIAEYLRRSIPILTGLSSTYLYEAPRVRPGTSDDDDVAGVPDGHFVMICGYSGTRRTVTVADPYLPNPVSASHRYEVPVSRAICSILLGILTYDANLLIIEPKHSASVQPGATRGED